MHHLHGERNGQLIEQKRHEVWVDAVERRRNDMSEAKKTTKHDETNFKREKG